MLISCNFYRQRSRRLPTGCQNPSRYLVDIQEAQSTKTMLTRHVKLNFIIALAKVGALLEPFPPRIRNLAPHPWRMFANRTH